VTLLDSPAQAPTNAQAYSVSELAFALKRTLEDAYGFVRLRGEIGKVTRHSSGHVYLTIKDDKACIDGVVWKMTARTLKAQPQQGLEVIVTGRITTYPSGSKYQLIIETLEPAGVGALLAQLERLKAKLAGEGLFERDRKRPIPAMPAVIGVVTSPSGAVIRDILHRIRDRWPAHVLVWPVVVQGETAAAQVCAAIRGFNALAPGGPVPRPDVLIVARGGGSVEDLWPFNDETLARTVAASRIPLISAVGHETDTTLIDYVSDRRAPTPTAAAEFATPVLAELRAALADQSRRLFRCGERTLEDRRTRLRSAARALPRPADLLAFASQRHDLAAGRLKAALERNTAVHERELVRAGARLTPALLDRPRRLKAERLADLSGRLRSAAVQAAGRAETRAQLPTLALRLDAAATRRLARADERLQALGQLLATLDPDRPLERGFARVHKADGALVRDAAELAPGEALRLHFRKGQDVAATVDGPAPERPAPAPLSPRPARRPRPPAASPLQGDLF
jgi:exodeoxyribonuclease VII large subunit